MLFHDTDVLGGCVDIKDFVDEVSAVLGAGVEEDGERKGSDEHETVFFHCRCCYILIILLFHLEQQPLEVFALGVEDADGMVGGMRKLAHHAHAAARVGGSGEHHGAEVVL